jgi:leucyl-tRNA synthetase
MPDGFVGQGDADIARATAKAIHEVTQGIDNFSFNKAIAKLYEFTNTLSKSNGSRDVMRAAMRTMAQLMQPMVPHIAESIWVHMGGQGLCAQAPWPVADPALLVDDTVTLPIQINGKRRAEITVPADMPPAEVEKLALADSAVVKYLDGAAVKKIIVVPGRIINVVA